MKIGDKVRYTVRWCDCAGLSAFDEARSRVGTVTAVEGSFVQVTWSPGVDSWVHPDHLCGEHEVSARALDRAKGFAGFSRGSFGAWETFEGYCERTKK